MPPLYHALVLISRWHCLDITEKEIILTLTSSDDGLGYGVTLPPVSNHACEWGDRELPCEPALCGRRLLCRRQSSTGASEGSGEGERGARVQRLMFAGLATRCRCVSLEKGAWPLFILVKSYSLPPRYSQQLLVTTNHYGRNRRNYWVPSWMHIKLPPCRLQLRTRRVAQHRRIIINNY